MGQLERAAPLSFMCMNVFIAIVMPSYMHLRVVFFAYGTIFAMTVVGMMLARSML